MYQIRMYLVSAGRNLYVRTLCFCFCFPFLFQHGTPTFLVTKVLGICVRSFIRREKENPPEILYTKRFPRGAPELLDTSIQLSNSVYGQNTVYLCLSKYSPTGSRCTTRSIAKKSPTGSSTCRAPRNHERSARGRTCLTTVTSISCRSF